MLPGTRVHCRMTKWGDRPHWRFEGTYLGEDVHGHWVGFPRGTHNSRPGFSFESEVDAVTLVPYDDWCLATFHAPGIWCDMYVDIATPAVWSDDRVTSTDLDLDVIRMSPAPADASPPPKPGSAWGQVFVDDEDEFTEHQVAYGYPDDVVRAARESCDRVLAAVRQQRAPYDGTHLRWLQALADL